MLMSAQTSSERFLRLIFLGMCFFGLLLLGLQSHAEPPAQASASKNHLLWPLLPGETLQSLATQLYPQSPILQQRFIQQSIALNRNHAGQSVNTVNLSADTQFQSPQLIVVPREQALTVLTHRIKKAEELLVSQHQNMATDDGQPFSDHRLSFQLSTSPKLTSQPQTKASEVKPTETDGHMPKVVPKMVFDEPPESTQADSQVTAPAKIEVPSVATPTPVPSAKVKTPSSTQIPSAPVQAKTSINIGSYWQTGCANLQANLRAFKQGNVHDWLRHPQLKWLCLQVLVLMLLVLYALIEMRLKRRELSSAKSTFGLMIFW